MAVTAITTRAKVKAALKTLVSESETFQTAVEAANATEALAHIHINQIDKPPIDETFALIINSGNDSNIADGINAGGVLNMLAGGDVELWLYRPIPESYQANHTDALTDFENFYEAVMNEIMALAGQPGYLIINNWQLIDMPARGEPESDNKNMYQIRLTISWGLTG